MPDFDIDFCQDRRDEVIRYVQQKYGRDRVAQIITFGKLQARAVLRDVGRVLGMPYGQVDRLCKLVPNNPAHPVSLAKAIAGEPQLQQAARQRRDRGAADDDRPEARRPLPPRLDPCRRRRHRRPAIGRAGAALPRPALRHAGDPVQHEMGRTGRARQIRLSRPQNPDRAGPLPGAPGGAWRHARSLQRCRSTTGRPSSCSPAATPSGCSRSKARACATCCKKLRPDRFEDIIAVVSLYRPGPMENIPRYIAVKHGEEAPDYLHPAFEGILKETHGIMIYQEQVMQIAQVLAGYTLGGADLLAPRDGQEDPVGDGRAAPAIRRGRPSTRRRAAPRRTDLRPDGEIRRLRLQQIARRRLCPRRLPDRVFEGELPGRVHGRVDDLRPRQHRQARPFPPGAGSARHRAVAARHQPLRCDLFG